MTSTLPPKVWMMHCLAQSAALERVAPSAHAQGDSLAHAHAQHGNLALEVAYGGVADSGIALRVAGPGADDQLRGVLRDELVERGFVVADHRHGRTFQCEVLVDIPGEGVVVVDQDHVGGGGDGRRGLGMVGRMVDDWQCGHRGRRVRSATRRSWLCGGI